ncbi:MAG TPA: DUF4062 domain-containing protein [Pyrinomonadaceae bacterium]|nr:DUF4062 domain-containing protein [Pyrinomonadaceae bacterium]
MESDIEIFISSTSDFDPERAELERHQELRGLCRQFHYGEFGAGSDEEGNTSPRAILESRLRGTDVFICLLGSRYGSLYQPPDSTKPISIVEWEFMTAQSRPGLEIMPFIKNVPREEIEASQLDFIGRVSEFDRGRWGKKYSSPGELPGVVHWCLQKWLARQYKKARVSAANWLNRMLAPVALGLILLCVVVSLLFITQLVPFSQSSVFGFCALTFFTVLLGIVALKSQMGR